MADILAFPVEPDLGAMSAEELKELLEAVRAQFAALDAQEPEDMMSEAYEAWGERHEALEDLADDILERLEGE